MNKRPLLRLSAVAVILASCFCASNLFAANRVWTGGGSPTNFNWTVATNWGGTAPIANDVLFFDGSTGTVNTNDFTVDTQFNGLVFTNTAGAFSLLGNTLTLGGNITNSSANSEKIILGLKYSAARTIDGGAGGIILGKGLTNTAPISSGTITTTFAGTGTISNQFNSNPGTNSLATTANANWTILDNPASTPVIAGIVQLNVINGGTFNFGSVSSAPNLTLGAMISSVDHTVGNGTGTSTLNVNGGTLIFSSRLNSQNGNVNINGGSLTATNGFQFVNSSAANVGVVTVNGGSLVAATGTHYNASRGNGTLTVNGGLVQCGTLDVCRVAAAGCKGTINLVGGILAANTISTGTANTTTPNGTETAVINFNGGTLRARQNSTVFITNNAAIVALTLNVQAGGAVIDSTNFAVNVVRPFTHDGTGPALDGGLTKLGSGILTLQAANTYTGPTRVNGGTLSLTNSGSIANSSKILVTNGAIFDVSQVSGGFNLAAGQLLGGDGVVTGAVTVATGAGISPGFSPGTLSLSNALTLNGSTTNFFELSNATNGSNDKLIVAGNLTLNGVNTIFVTKANGTLQTGRYTLITYGGTLTGSVAANLALAGISSVGTRQIVYLTNDIAGEIDLIVAGSQPANLTWAGNGVNNNWDLTTTTDWLTNGSPAQFFNDDTVGFGDSGSKSPAVNLVGLLAPASVTVSNATGSYAFSDAVSGSGKLTGGGALIKTNAGTLALFENAGDDFSGGIQVNGGTLVLSNNNVAISGGIAVNNGATLTDAHGGTISGGIAVNNGTAQIAGSAGVSGGVSLTTGSLTIKDNPAITGNVTVNGGTALVGGSGSITGNLLTSGGNTTVTNNPSAIVNVTVNGGSVLLEQDSGAAAPSGNTVISGAGSLQLGNNDNRGALNLAGGSTLTDNGAFTINRTDDISVDGTLSGTGTFTQAGTNTVTVTADNNGFTGPVSVQKGTLRLGNNRAFGTTTAGITVASGATLDLNTFTLTNASVIAGGGGVTNGGAVVNNGASGAGRGIRLLTLTTNITLGGLQRWDLRNVGGTAVLTNNNNPFGITKVGTNQVSLVNVSVDPALGDIDVQQGLFSLEQTTTSAGNPSSNLTVRSGATLQLFQLQTPLNKVITLNGSGTNTTLNGASGNAASNIIASSVTLNGDTWISVSGGANLTFSNISGPGTLLKIGSGTNYMYGAANYAGVTVVSNGVLSINGTAPTNNISVYGDTTTPAAGILSGTSTLTQPVSIGDYGTLNPGNGIGTMTISNTVTFSANATNVMEINRSASPNSDLVRGVTTLNAAGTVLVTNLGVSPQYGDVFKLYDAGAYSGTFGTLALPSLTFPLLWNTNLLVDGTLSVDIDPSGNLIWTGANSGDWDTGTQNWKLAGSGTPANYSEPSGVQFDDSAVGPTNVNLTATFAPVSLVISNNTKTYTFSGSGNLTGNAVLQKKGSGRLLLDNTGINDFNGGAVISAGTVQVGTNDANGNFPGTGPIVNNGSLVFDRTDTITFTNTISGSGSVSHIGSGQVNLYGINSYSGPTLISGGTLQISNTSVTGTSSLGLIPGGAVTITNGGTLDLGGNTTVSAINFTNANGFKQFFIAGSGVGGAGAIVNSINTNQQNAFQLITLTADSVFGGLGRWDMRGGPTNAITGAQNPSLNLAGHKLTKTGGNQISLVNVQVSSGDIQVDQGVLSFEGSSAVNPTGTITVNPSGYFGHFRTWGGAITRAMTLNGGTVTNLSTSGGASTNDSPITLIADSILASASGSDLYINGTISGAFGLTKNGTGTVILPANPGYSGSVTVNAGTLQFGTNSTTGNLPASSSVTDNGTLAWNRSDDLTILNTINGTGGITQSGTNTLTLDNPGALTGNTTIASGGTLQVGINDALGSLPTGNITDNGLLVFKRNDTFTVNGIVSGTGKVAQSGTNTVKLFGANTYSGGTLVTNGFLQVSNNTSLGTAGPANGVIITNGGTLDLGGNVTANNLTLRAFTIQVSGAGVTNGGAIMSSGSVAQQNALTNVTLLGNTTFGGVGDWHAANNPGRWDIRGAGSQLSTGGNPYKLTKVGGNQVNLVNVTVDPQLGDIDVQGGEFGYEAGTTGLGNANSNLFVRAGATLDFFQATNALNKVITVFGDGATTNILFGSGAGGPTNVIIGTVQLNSSNVVIGGNAPGTFSNVISGAQGLIVNGGTSLRVNLAATNTYTGNTLVSVGTLALLGPSQLTNSPVITIASANAGIDVTGRTAPSAATLVIASNQVLYGNGSVTGNLGINQGGLVSPGTGAGTIGTLNLTVSATTSGRILMEINKSNPVVTNDLITAGGPLVCGGTLSVTNLGPALVVGDTFRLLTPSSFVNAFTLDLADPGPGLAWNTNNLYVDGSLSVTSNVAPGPTTNATITKVTRSGTNIVVHGTNNNVPNTSFHYVALQTTNILTPLSNWIPAVTNPFNVDGTFDYTNPIVPGTPRQFIDIQVVP